ncbi:hypothetical protein K1719_013411 [Acacia pycnantha]|nr:hypothetical protein K1719_013411 [Acacia pycnantha]
MEKDQHSSSKKQVKEVHLELKNSVNDQKGRALVGRLEKDKTLNRGVVISMIRKGWGLDRGMEIHDMPEKNAYLFRFGRQEDYDRVLKGRPWAIQGVLLNIQHCDNYMILREVNFDWCPFWVQFHVLPHGAFDSDNAVKLGNAVGRTVLFEAPRVHERLSRTFVKDITNEDDEDTRSGSGLGTAHVKIIKEALEVYDNTWDEAAMIRKKPRRQPELPTHGGGSVKTPNMEKT